MPNLKLISFICALSFFPTVFAAEVLKIDNAWSPEAPPVAKVMAGYVTFSNPGKTPQTIVFSSSPNFSRVEIHEMEHKDGMMRMYRLQHLIIDEGKSVSLEPGGKHLMLIGPKQRLTNGAQFPVTFEFMDGTKQTVNFKVMLEQDSNHHH